MITPSLERTANVAKDNICKNNLATIYRASMVYVDDNDTILMGPAWSAARPHVQHRRGWYYNHFAKYLAAYMFVKVADNGATYIQEFICPRNEEKFMQGRQAIHHRAHYRVTQRTWTRNGPLYGRPGWRNRVRIAPQSIHVIGKPSKKDFLKDADLGNSPWLERIKSDNSTVPVHDGEYRNVLYFDGNVNPVEWSPSQ